MGNTYFSLLDDKEFMVNIASIIIELMKQVNLIEDKIVKLTNIKHQNILIISKDVLAKYIW